MNYLLIGGAPNTGKTEMIFELAEHLLNNNYSINSGNLFWPNQETGRVKDFLCYLQGINRNGLDRKVIVNSASDDDNCIRKLKKCKEDHPEVDVIITSIREDGDPIRNLMIAEMNIKEIDDIFIEMPLAKITRRNNFNIALEWYRRSIRNLIFNMLEANPLNL